MFNEPLNPSSHTMIAFFSNLLKQSPEPVPTPPTQQTKILAFNSIVSILSQIQQEPPFKDNEISSAKPANSQERLQLRLSNAFAHLAIIDVEVAAATMYTPGRFFILAWMQDQDPDDPHKPEAAPQEPSIWERLLLMIATNTKISDFKAKNNYPGPRIVGVAPPPGYPNASDPKTSMLEYLDQFPKRW